MNDRVLIFGAGGHARVVIDIILEQDVYAIAGIVDDYEPLHGTEVFGHLVLGKLEEIEAAAYADCLFVVAIGGNQARMAASKRVAEQGFRFATPIHPSVVIGRGVSIGTGSVFMAGVVINPNADIGEHTVINTGATIDHDCQIADYAQVAPGAHLAGDVRIGRAAYVGIGASVIQGVRIGEGTMVGAGAAVVHDLPANVTAVGVPARIIKDSAST